MRDLPAGATPLDFAYDVHTDVGHRCVGAKINGRIVPLTYTLQSGDFVEILTSKAPRAPSRDWLKLVKTTKARSKISQFFRRERREDAEHRGREALQDSLRKAGLPSQRVAGSPAAARGHPGDGLPEGRRVLHLARPRQDLGAGRRQQDPAPAEGRPGGRRGGARPGVAPRGRRPHSATASSDLGIEIDGLADVLVRLAKCCKPVPGDPILGYISLGPRDHHPPRGLPQRQGAAEEPGALHAGLAGAGPTSSPFGSRSRSTPGTVPRLLEDLSRAFAESGVNIISAHCAMEDQMVHDRFTVDVGDVETLKSAHQRPPPRGVGLRRLPGDARQLIRARRRRVATGPPATLPRRGMARSRGPLGGHPRRRSPRSASSSRRSGRAAPSAGWSSAWRAPGDAVGRGPPAAHRRAPGPPGGLVGRVAGHPAPAPHRRGRRRLRADPRRRRRGHLVPVRPRRRRARHRPRPASPRPPSRPRPRPRRRPPDQAAVPDEVPQVDKSLLHGGRLQRERHRRGRRRHRRSRARERGLTRSRWSRTRPTATRTARSRW